MRSTGKVSNELQNSEFCRADSGKFDRVDVLTTDPLFRKTHHSDYLNQAFSSRNKEERSMKTIVIVEVKAKQGSVDDLLKTFSKFTPVARSTEGNISLDLIRDQDDPDTIILYEIWESRNHYEKYLAHFEELGKRKVLDALIEGDASIRYFDVTPV